MRDEKFKGTNFYMDGCGIGGVNDLYMQIGRKYYVVPKAIPLKMS